MRQEEPTAPRTEIKVRGAVHMSCMICPYPVYKQENKLPKTAREGTHKLSITTIYKHLLIDFDNFLILHISKMQCILYMQKADWSYRRRLVFGHDTGKSQIESEMKQRMEAMSFGESLLISLTGLAVVFTVLIVLALATIAIAKIIGKLTGAQSAPVSAPAAAPAASPAVPPVEEDLSEVVAVLQGALSMESGIPVDKLMITSVKRVPDTSDKQQ